MNKRIGDFLLVTSRVHLVSGNHEAVLRGLTADSREVEGGWAFFALRGEHTDGHRFIAEAIHRGASCIVSTIDVDVGIVHDNPGVCFIVSPEILEFMSEFSVWFYETAEPSLVAIGITGTNGKTTIATMLNHALKADGRRTIFIGTTGFEVVGRTYPTDFTTPPTYVIQRLIREGLDAGAEFLVMEVSSHALKFQRVVGLVFDVVVFTNLTHEHKEIHPDMEDYFQTKRQLFNMLKPGGLGIVNADDAYGARIIREYGGEGVLHDYGRQSADMRLESTIVDKSSCRQLVGLITGGKDLVVDSCLPGDYNAYNVAATAGVLVNLGWSVGSVSSVLSAFPGVEGRFSRYRVQGIEVVIDFAHTPDGLSQVLQTTRSLTAPGSQLLVVFGCPGSRDRSKRPLMGKIASEFSDWVVVTTDDIHYEKPETIAADIVAGIHKENYEVVLDRRQAVRRALERSRMGDWIVIAGRGHEGFQYVEGRKVPFKDGDVLIEEAAGLGHQTIRL